MKRFLKKSSLIPNRFQSSVELLYEFVSNMVKENVGTGGKKYFPFIFSLFMFPQSWGFAVTAFCLGVISKLFHYALEFHHRSEQAKVISEAGEELGDAFSKLFNLQKDSQ